MGFWIRIPFHKKCVTAMKNVASGKKTITEAKCSKRQHLIIVLLVFSSPSLKSMFRWTEIRKLNEVEKLEKLKLKKKKRENYCDDILTSKYTIGNDEYIEIGRKCTEEEGDWCYDATDYCYHTNTVFVCQCWSNGSWNGSDINCTGHQNNITIMKWKKLSF